MKRTPELVFVTGAGSGIGRATTLRFAGMGATVIPTDINEGAAEETAALVQQAGGTAHAYRLDVADAAAFEELAAQIRDTRGVPDVVVNNAGIVTGGSFLEHTMADWHRLLGIMLAGVFHGSRIFGAQMVERGRGGHIVNTSSIGGIVPVGIGPAYCTAKAGVKMLSECLSAELTSHGIGVSAICPGLINTNLVGSLTLPGEGSELLCRTKGLGDSIMPLLGRSPDNVAKAIVRAVRYDLTVVPVTAEAWLGAALWRIAPGLVRAVSQVGTMDRANWIARKLPGKVDASVSRLAAHRKVKV